VFPVAKRRVVIGVTKELTHGSGLDRKSIGLRTTDLSCQVPVHVFVLYGRHVYNDVMSAAVISSIFKAFLYFSGKPLKALM